MSPPISVYLNDLCTLNFIAALLHFFLIFSFQEILRRDWMFKLVGEDTFYLEEGKRCIIRVINSFILPTSNAEFIGDDDGGGGNSPVAEETTNKSND